MALKLSLKPGERVVVNGAVVVNGDDRRATIVVQNKASILRERDILTEEQADTPAKRVYVAVMLAYMDAAGADRYYAAFVERMAGLMGALENPQAKLTCAQVSIDMMNREHYRALTGCRKLVDYEASVFGETNVARRLQTDAGDRRVA